MDDDEIKLSYRLGVHYADYMGRSFSISRRAGEPWRVIEWIPRESEPIRHGTAKTLDEARLLVRQVCTGAA